MAEKNTISILESIKKKMHNFEKPREAKSAGFAAVGDEFDYISSNKKDAATNPQENKVDETKNNAAAANQASNVLEKEMDETFSSFLSKNAEEKPEKPAAEQKNDEIVPPVKAEEKPAQDPQDDFLNSFASEPEVQSALVAEAQELSFEEHHEEEHHEAPATQADPVATALPNNHDDDAAFDFLDDHSLDDHLNEHNEMPAKAQPEIHHDELHELNQALGNQAAPSAEHAADEHDFSFLHDDLHEEIAPTQNVLEKKPTFNAQAQTESEDAMENFLESDAPSVEAVASAQKPAVKNEQNSAFLPNFDSSLPPQSASTPTFAQQAPLPPRFENRQFNSAQMQAPTANYAAVQNDPNDDFDEEAFLKADETKLRQEYAANKAAEPKIDANQVKNDISQNKRQQVISAADSLLKGNALDQTSDSLKKLLEAKNAVSTVASFAKGDNLNEIALQLLEPRLEKWLNENLPALVDKIVREEINKIMPKN